MGVRKTEFFYYSSPVLYKNSSDLSLISNVVLPKEKIKIIFNFKKWGKTLAFIMLAIITKSICQYYLGAQETSWDKIILGLDYPFYQGCLLGGIILSFFQDNWNNMWDYIHKSITIRLDSEDEDSGNEVSKNLQKGKDKLTDSNISSKVADKEKSVTEVASTEVASTEGSSSGSTSRILISIDDLAHVIATYGLAADEIAKDTKSYTSDLSVLAELVGNFNTLGVNLLDMKKPGEVEKAIIPLLQEHGSTYSKYQNRLVLWIKSRAINLEDENKIKVKDAIANAEIARDKYLSVVHSIDTHNSATTQAKVYYAALNEQRKSVNKELNKATDIVLKDLKASPFCAIKGKESKNLINTLKDFSNVKKEFNTQDNYLKKKIGEVINKRN